MLSLFPLEITEDSRFAGSLLFLRAVPADTSCMVPSDS